MQMSNSNGMFLHKVVSQQLNCNLLLVQTQQTELLLANAYDPCRARSLLKLQAEIARHGRRKLILGIVRLGCGQVLCKS